MSRSTNYRLPKYAIEILCLTELITTLCSV
jgi:hypothetical protein